MNQNNELYHYGVPGMKWGQRRGTQKGSNSKSKKKLSKGAKIAIGATAATAALAGIGAMLTSKTVQNKHLTLMAGKRLVDNMW